MNINGKLIPAKFLILVAHLTVCIILLWSSSKTVKGCLPENYSQHQFWEQHNQFIIGLGFAVGMIAFELLAFLTGFTIFNSGASFLSIICHAAACVCLAYLVLDGWQCGWFWWIFDQDLKIKNGWSKLLLLAGISTTFALSLPVGYNIGVVNSPAEIIKNFCNESIYRRFDYALNEGQLKFLWSSIVSIFLVGGAVGSLSGSWMADIAGRKGALVADIALYIIAGVLFLAAEPADSVEMLLIGRLLVGFAGGLATCVVPMYLIELAPLDLRGAMGVFCPLGVTSGVLIAQILSLSQVLGTQRYWPHCLFFYTTLVVAFGSLIIFLPESPKYLLLIKKQPQEAFKQLERIRDKPRTALEDEIRDLQLALQDINVSNTEKWNIWKVITNRTLLLPLLLVCALQAGQQFSGINAVFYYSVAIFEQAGLSHSSSQLGTIGAGAVNLLMGIVSIYVMSRFQRRCCIQLSCLSAVLCLILLSITIKFITTSPLMPYLCIIAVLSFVLAYGIGLGPIPYFIGSELFEVGPRPSAMALGSMANWGGNFFVGMFFPALQDYIGSACFLIFAATTFALLLFIRFYLPETKGRDPSDIYQLCKNGFKSSVLKLPVNTSINSETVDVTDKVV